MRNESYSETVMRAAQGRRSAVGRLFGELMPSLTSWARGRLPLWARARVDTEDVVHDAVIKVMRHLPTMKARRRRTIRAYLRRAIRNQMTDEMRRAGKVEVAAKVGMEPPSPEADPMELAIDAEQQALYRAALEKLSESDRELIVGRLELGYSYEQLALASGKSSPDAARMAVRRAVERLVREMSA